MNRGRALRNFVQTAQRRRSLHTTSTRPNPALAITLTQLVNLPGSLSKSERFAMGQNVSRGFYSGGEEERGDVDPELVEKAEKRPREMTDDEWRQLLTPEQ